MSRSIFQDITADKLLTLREESGKGLMECKGELQRQAALVAICELEMERVIDPRLGELLAYLVVERRR